MSEDTGVESADEHGADERKPWHKPEMSLLPVEETATGFSAGSDGAGPTTGS